jgi:hypothetical protein
MIIGLELAARRCNSSGVGVSQESLKIDATPFALGDRNGKIPRHHSRMLPHGERLTFVNLPAISATVLTVAREFGATFPLRGLAIREAGARARRQDSDSEGSQLATCDAYYLSAAVPRLSSGAVDLLRTSLYGKEGLEWKLISPCCCSPHRA